MKYTTKELKGSHDSIEEDVKARAEQNDLDSECINWNISADTMKSIGTDQENGIKLLDEMLSDCHEGEGISNQDVNKYYSVIKESYLESKKKSESKVSNIYKIWRIWMYSDGIDENSPFDLITDIEEINRIIFEQEYEYNWVNNYDLSDLVDGVLDWESYDEALDQYSYATPNATNTSTPIKKTDGSTTICQSNNSGLSSDEIGKIFWNGENNENWSNIENTPAPIIADNWYSKTNDDETWPCNDFFCITVEFKTYNHKLLGGWGNLSIEGLINRSNGHLKKFVNTSLVQAKMTTNNFELGLRDLNLPDIFHVGVVVSYKPVPILDLDKQDKKWDRDETDYSYEHLEERYYANYWLDAQRANDISRFHRDEAQLKSSLDATEQSVTQMNQKYNDYEIYATNLRKQNEYLSDTLVDRKIVQEDSGEFYYKYTEVETFIRAMMEYTIDVYGDIKKMNEIPTSGDSL